MENASKALLIAAAVLITIVLIALGVSLLNSASGTQDSAQKTGNMISDKTNQMVGTVIDEINDIDILEKIKTMDNRSFNQFLYYEFIVNGDRRTGDDVLLMCKYILEKYGTLRSENNYLKAHISGNSPIPYTEIMDKIVSDKYYKIYQVDGYDPVKDYAYLSIYVDEIK